jgi:hypothetical protein
MPPQKHQRNDDTAGDENRGEERHRRLNVSPEQKTGYFRVTGQVRMPEKR